MNERTDDLKIIREMMEKSTKFLSLSGLSGVFAGMAAILGASFAYFYLLKDPSKTDYNQMQELMILLTIAIIVLIVAISFAIWFSWKKAKKIGEKLFNPTFYRVLYNFAIPLVAGGVFGLACLFRGEIDHVISITLIFYGLALFSASKLMFKEIHYLGITEIVFGLLSALLCKYGLLFWVLGFGVAHIFYGFLMYIKYDRKSS